MQDFVFITGNQHKVEQLQKWLGSAFEHQAIDLEELQSLDPHEVVEHKARQAYGIVKKPVLVEDISLTFTAMGRLPGTLIKWFLQEIGPEGLTNIARNLPSNQATARVLYALYDGRQTYTFEHAVAGSIAAEPRGKGHGWNPIFMPDGSTQTFAEMNEEDTRVYSLRSPAITKLKVFLESNA